MAVGSDGANGDAVLLPKPSPSPPPNPLRPVVVLGKANDPGVVALVGGAAAGDG
jgi:hypothetical protein